MKKLGLIFFLLFTQVFVFGQLESSIDSTQIKIGEPVRLQYKLKFDPKNQVQTPEILDTLSFHIEVLDYKYDTLKIAKNLQEIVLNLQVTSYEAGEFLIKPLSFVVNQDTIRSSAFQIKVNDVMVDVNNPQLSDNKPIMLEEYTFSDYWNKYWIYGIVALLLCIIALILVILYIRSKNKGLKSAKYKTPYQEMMDELKSIDKKKFLQRGEQKEFYSRLSTALKNYIGRVYGFSAKELLSDEVVTEVAKKEDVLQDDVRDLKQFLYNADLVKFAKQTLNDDQNMDYRKWVESFVNRIKPIDIPQNKDLDQDEITGENFRKIKD